MPPTPNEIARLRAGRFDREYRVSLLPPRAYVQQSLFVAGEPVTNYPAATLLDGTVTPQSTTIQVEDTALYPVIGMICVRDGSDATWFTHTNKTSISFTGCQFHHGAQRNYTVGTAFVTAAVDVTDKLTGWPVIESWEQLPVRDWKASLKGAEYRDDVFLPDATFLIEQRLTPEGVFGTWTPWKVACLGYAAAGYNVEADADGHRRWTATLYSARIYASRHRVSSRQYGRLNLAASKSASASSVIGNPLLEPAEFAEGFHPPVADNVTDGSLNTVYISNNAPTLVAETPGASNLDLTIDEVMPVSSSGAPPDLWYITLRLAPGATEVDLKFRRITTGRSLYNASGVTEWPHHPYDHYIPLTNLSLTIDQPTIILTNDAPAFLEYYGNPPSARVVDVRFQPKELPDADGPIAEANAPEYPAANLDLYVDDVVHSRQVGRSIPGSIRDMVVWGNRASIPILFAENDHYDDGLNNWGPGGVDPGVTLGAAGTSIRRTPTLTDTNRSTDWAIELTPIPGDARDRQDRAWLSIDLGEFSINSAFAMTISDPPTGGDWQLTDATPLDETGTARIGDEQISYLSRDADTLYGIVRGANGSTAAAHTTSELVYQQDTALGPTRLYRVGEVVLRRKPIYEGDLLVKPSFVELWGSTTASPTYPPEDATTTWKASWVGSNPLAVYDEHGEPPGANPDVTIHEPESRRLRHVMAICYEMTDGGRFKLNELLVWHAHTRETGLDEAGLGAPIRDMAQEVFDAAQIEFDGDPFARVSPDRTISEGKLSDILEELGEQSLVVVWWTLDDRLVFEKYPTHPDRLNSLPEVFAAFDSFSVRSPQQARIPTRLGVAQVIAEVTDPVSLITYIGEYPPVAGAGEVKRIPIQRTATNLDEADAIARALYLDDEAISASYEIETAGPAEWAYAGQRNLLQLFVAGPQSYSQNCRITRVVSGGAKQVERLTFKEWRLA